MSSEENFKSNSEMLMKILCYGGRVEHKGYTYAMLENGELAIVAVNDGNDEVYLSMDCSMAQFKSLADAIGRDELWLGCCAIEMQKMNQRKRGTNVPNHMSQMQHWNPPG